MKANQSQSQKGIKTLEKAFDALQSKLGKNTDTAGLAGQVAELSSKISEISNTANSDITSTLSKALANPTTEGLTAALTLSEKRMEAAETVQSEAIAKVNRHIADMAMAIDKRFRHEADLRNAAISTVRREAFARIQSVETESVQAISGLGEKVIAVSEELTRRADGSESVIKEKVSEIALKTQEEFEQYRANLERRIETLESIQQKSTSLTDQALTKLTTRMEGLEYVAAENLMPPDATPRSNVTYPSISQDAPAEGGNSADPSMTARSMLSERLDASKDTTHTPPGGMDDAFSPDSVSKLSAPIVPPNPYAIPEPIAVDDVLDEHLPREFNPLDIQPANHGDGDQIPAPTRHIPAPAPVPAPISAPAIAMSALAFDAEPVSGLNPLPEPLSAEQLGEPEISAPYSDPVYANAAYADPAYAEDLPNRDMSMDSARPGNFGEEKKRFSIPNLPSMSSQNMKVAGIAVAVCAISLIGVKALGGKPASTSAPSDIVASNGSLGGIQPSTAPTLNEPGTMPTTPTIGEYADNRVDIAVLGSAEASTLESAAQAGNPVAQFQLGVSLLENGNTDDAVKLIRAAADQGQPAAQYRLAKLYELGEGVTLNADMARQLTERAARNGNRIAMHDLALYHAEGRGGLSTDLDTAAKWFEKAAQRGVVDSQFNLGVMFETGKGVPKNMNDAFVWYSIASEQGDQFAKQRVGFLKDQLPAEDLRAAKARITSFKPSKIDQAANGIFKDLPWAAKKKATPAADGRVQQVQTMLMDLGFDTGGADGSVGPKTRTAIMNFEKANGLPETGRVNDDLVEKLEFASGA